MATRTASFPICFTTCALFFAGLLMAGCGNKGELYLKSDGSAREQLQQIDETLRELDENQLPLEDVSPDDDEDEDNKREREKGSRQRTQ